MSAGSRSTQGGQHGARGEASSTLTPALSAALDDIADAHFAALAAADAQDSGKPVTTLSVLAEAADLYVIPPGSCNGPTGPCALEFGHPGSHWRLRSRGALPVIDVHECSICHRVHGQEITHGCE